MRMNKVLRKILRILLYFTFLSGTIALAAPPVPFFFGTPQEGTAPFTVLFTDASDGDVTVWTWDFGDGTTSHQKDPVHQYNEPGYYSVTLFISGPKGTDTITRLGYIFVSEPDSQEGNDASSLAFANLYEDDLILDDILADTHNQKEDLEEGEKSIPNRTAINTPAQTPLPEATQEPVSTQLDPALYASLNNSIERSENELETEEIGEIIQDITPDQTPLSGDTQEPIITQLDPTLYASLRRSTERCEENPALIFAPVPLGPPRAIFTIQPIEGMVPLTVTFADTSIGSVKERIWSFGDKTESEDPIVEHTYTKAGTYPVSLIVTGDDGTMDRGAGFITVFPLPNPPVPKIACNTMEVFKITCEAVISPEAGDVNWLWEFGDGRTSAEQDPVHTYEALGTYIISVTAIDAYEQTGFDSIEVSLELPPLDVAFTYEIDDHEPMTVTFAGNEGPETWNWEFGDGETGIGQVVTHTYHIAGDMSVTLTVADAYQEQSISSIVTINLPPLDVAFTYEIDDHDPMTVTFTGNEGPETWAWEFGDGETGIGQVVTHTYHIAGDMSVTLTVADAYQEQSISSVVTINPPPLDVVFTYEINDHDPMSVTFTGNEGPDTWNWEFGDGETGIGQVVAHTYHVAGEMSARLTVADAYQENQLSQEILIYAPPIDVDFAITLSDAQEPYTVLFLDRSYGPIMAWQWYFGDGKESNEQNPAHTYSETGEYTAQLIITSQYGDTKMQQVRFIILDQGNGNVLYDTQSDPTMPHIDLNDTSTAKGNTAAQM